MSLKQDCQGRFFFFKDKTQILTVDGRFRIAQLNATLGNEMPTWKCIRRHSILIGQVAHFILSLPTRFDFIPGVLRRLN